MNTRVLGTLTMIGGLAGVLFAVRLVLWPEITSKPGDMLGQSLNLLWQLGNLCLVLGILRLNVTGTGRLARGLTYVPLATAVLGVVVTAALVVGRPLPLPIAILTILGGLAGFIIIGVLALRARRWEGWRRFVLLAYPGAYLLAGLLRLVSISLPPSLFVALASIIIGYAVLSSNPASSGETARVAVNPSPTS